jgi:hypothetical protein
VDVEDAPALGAGTRDEAANSGVAVAVDIGPHNGRAEPKVTHFIAAEP